MSNSSLRSLRPLLIGSFVVLSVACRRADDRSQTLDTTTPAPSARSAESAPMPTVMPDQRPASDLNREERMPVTGRDDIIDLGTGGSTSTGGSGGNGGSAGSHHH